MDEQTPEPITKETTATPPKRESGAQKKQRLRVASPPPPLAVQTFVKRGREKKKTAA
jgi:hypothetical protein